MEELFHASNDIMAILHISPLSSIMESCLTTEMMSPSLEEEYYPHDLNRQVECTLKVGNSLACLYFGCKETHSLFPPSPSDLIGSIPNEVFYSGPSIISFIHVQPH